MPAADAIIELYGHDARANVDWTRTSTTQHCTYLSRKCLKNRKSEPNQTIGTCSVGHGDSPIIICPHRLLERRQVFTDCLHLLTRHEPGNELHLIPELSIPGGSLDYVLASVHRGKVVDFVGIELQTLDSTGTIWPKRQEFLRGKGVRGISVPAAKSFGMNWKMTAKTILVQLHHKVTTFESLSRHLVLIVQDRLLDYMRENFRFNHIGTAKLGHAMHFHAYSMADHGTSYRLELQSRSSTDADGIAECLGLQTEANITLEQFVESIEAKISSRTLVTL